MSDMNVKDAADLGAALAEVKEVEKHPFAILPAGYQVHDLESFLETPLRKKGTVKLRDEKSFIEYFKKHQLGSAIYGTRVPAKFTAIFDDHRKDEPGWREHRAIYECHLSTEWNTWKAANKRVMSQADFAQFIEDNLPDIVSPSGAEMLEISRTLEAKKKVDFASAIRLDNGAVQFTYNEATQGTAAKGKFTIPEVFHIGIPVLDGGAPYKIEARFRYRIAEGNLSMWYDLLRAHKVYEDAIMEVWKTIQEETKASIFHGEP